MGEVTPPHFFNKEISMETLIVMQRDGFYKLEPRFVGKQLNALERFASPRVPQIVHNLCTVPYADSELDTSLSVINNFPTLFTALPFLRLNCHWFVQDDWICPDFKSPPSGELLWYPPQHTNLVFCTNKNGSFVSLVADGKAYQLPLPNIHEDGRCCLNIDLPDNLIERHKASVKQFYAGNWNTDLFPEWKEKASAYVFRYTMHDKQAITDSTQVLPIDAIGTEISCKDYVIQRCLLVYNPSIFNFLEVV
jgi:hypothetical protein